MASTGSERWVGVNRRTSTSASRRRTRVAPWTPDSGLPF